MSRAPCLALLCLLVAAHAHASPRTDPTVGRTCSRARRRGTRHRSSSIPRRSVSAFVTRYDLGLAAHSINIRSIAKEPSMSTRPCSRRAASSRTSGTPVPTARSARRAFADVAGRALHRGRRGAALSHPRRLSPHVRGRHRREHSVLEQVLLRHLAVGADAPISACATRAIPRSTRATIPRAASIATAAARRAASRIRWRPSATTSTSTRRCSRRRTSSRSTSASSSSSRATCGSASRITRRPGLAIQTS